MTLDIVKTLYQSFLHRSLAKSLGLEQDYFFVRFEAMTLEKWNDIINHHDKASEQGQRS